MELTVARHLGGEAAMSQTMRTVLEDTSFEHSVAGVMTQEEIRSRIEEVGVVPRLRRASAADAVFVASALAEAGIPLLEISMNAPGAIDVLSHVIKHIANAIVGAGSITDTATAQRCLAAGARFLTSDALIFPVVELAVKENVVVLPGAFTPTEILAASHAGADFVKVVPCDAAGGDSYIRSVKAALSDVALIAAGGVTQLTAAKMIAAGATGVGVGMELIPAEALRLRQTRRIQELARRFLSFVDSGRIDAAGQNHAATSEP
jgi:2-dehydro-3-deoxyphosphogluconate aldolase / (4S)-4-hydroxy-2-oxoglutarate aldolase